MTTKDNNILALIAEFKALKIWQIAKRRQLKNKIYEAALPNIKEKLFTIPSIDDEICKIEYRRIYANTANYLFSSKKFNSKSFDNVLNPKSKKNDKARSKIKSLFNLLTEENPDYASINKAIKHMDAAEKTTFEHITGVDLKIFNF